MNTFIIRTFIIRTYKNKQSIVQAIQAETYQEALKEFAKYLACIGEAWALVDVWHWDNGNNTFIRSTIVQANNDEV